MAKRNEAIGDRCSDGNETGEFEVNQLCTNSVGARDDNETGRERPNLKYGFINGIVVSEGF